MYTIVLDSFDAYVAEVRMCCNDEVTMAKFSFFLNRDIPVRFARSSTLCFLTIPFNFLFTGVSCSSTSNNFFFFFETGVGKSTTFSNHFFVEGVTTASSSELLKGVVIRHDNFLGVPKLVEGCGSPGSLSLVYVLVGIRMDMYVLTSTDSQGFGTASLLSLLPSDVNDVGRK